MANYHLVLNVICFVSLFVLLRKLLGRWFKPIAHILSAIEKNDHTGRQVDKRKSILDRIRDRVFPKIPMV